MSFKESVDADIKNVFLNPAEFGELRTVVYDDVTYEDILVVISSVKEKDRRTMLIQNGRRDNIQGLYMSLSVLHCARADLGGKMPEKGQSLKINNREGGGGFFKEYRVAASGCASGMLRVELEAIDE